MPIPKSEKIWFNGKLVNWDDAKIHVMSHVIHYGSSVFEGVRCYNTSKGSAVFCLQAHVQRLLNSAKIYRMNVAYSADELANAILETIRANKLKECYIRPIIFRGYGEIGVTRWAARSTLWWLSGSGGNISAKRLWSREWTSVFPPGRASLPIPCPR